MKSQDKDKWLMWMLFWEQGWIGEGKREHENTLGLENDLEVMLEIKPTYLTALLKIGDNAKGMG